MLKLQIKKRADSDKLFALEKTGRMPAVFYGKKEKSTSISIARADFLKAWKQAGESSVVVLEGDGLELESLIQDVDVHPVTGVPRHADFYVFEKGKKIEVSVPIEFVGVSPAVKDLGGILVKVLHELKVEALPRDLPHEIKIDISPLKDFESQILAKDLVLPATVTLMEKADEVVASVSQPKEEPVEEAPVDLSSIEVEKKGKVEEEGEAGEGAEKAPAKEAKDKAGK